jgi:cytochrome c peroxidase
MHGHGTFTDARIAVNVQNPPDMVSSKLAALRAYQFSLDKPAPVQAEFDVAAAARGRTVFEGDGECSSCHRGSTFTDITDGELHARPKWGRTRHMRRAA